MPLISISGTPIDFPDSPYIVYGLCEPMSMKVRYIGKTVCGINRIREHGKPSSLKNDGNTPKANWIRKLQSAGKTYSYVILFAMDPATNKQEASLELYRKEQELIKKHSNLLNLQDGGPGSTNRVVKELTRKKMSIAAKKRGLPTVLKKQQESPYPNDLISDGSHLRFCSYFKKFMPIFEFSFHVRFNRYSRISKKARTLQSKSYKRYTKVPAGLRFKSAKKPMVATNMQNKATIFTSQTEAAQYLGGTASKTGIRWAVKNKKPYYGYTWSYL